MTLLTEKTVINLAKALNYFLFYHQGGFIRKIEWVYQTQWGVSEVLSPNQTKAQRKSQWKTVWIQVSHSTYCSYMFCLCGYILEYCTNLSWILLRLDLDVSVVLWTKETDNLSISSCSENYIFGKFDAFCKRLEKINDMLNTMETFAGVNNIKIEVQCKQGHSSLNKSLP